MAKKGGSHQSKTPAEKKETTKRYKERNILRAEMVKNPKSNEINSRTKEMINSGLHTFDIKLALSKEFDITHTVANDYIRRNRKKMKIYNYGSNNSNKQIDEKKKVHRNFYLHDDESLNKQLDGVVK